MRRRPPYRALLAQGPLQVPRPKDPRRHRAQDRPRRARAALREPRRRQQRPLARQAQGDS